MKIRIVLLLIILLCTGCKKEKNQSNPPSNISNKIEYNSLVASHYEIEYSATGDLNGDKLNDLALVVKKRDKSNGIREVMVFLKNSKGYSLDITSKTVFPEKYLSEEDDIKNYVQEEIEIKDQTLFINLYGIGPQSNTFSHYKYQKETLSLIYVESYAMGAGSHSNLEYNVSEGKIKLETTNTTRDDMPTKVETINVDGMGYSFNTCNPEELISYAYDRMRDRNRFVVIAKNGLLIRERPDIYSERIWQLPFNKDIEVLEKTDVSFSFKDEESYVTIDGHWVKVAFDNVNGNNQHGYVFDGFLQPYEAPTIFRGWSYLDHIYLSIHKNAITYELHGQCHYSFPTKVLNKKDVELIWDYNADCVFDSQLSNDFGLQKPPVVGKPFAKYSLEGRVLKVTYYYKEWVKAYSENVNRETFPNEFIERYY
ncbi:SH3 domain-containing protein [Aquimarina aquimarini]|uniref:SH3 domain-containing protein n=1 Tax=Aquimarina aquimarini TaxID=1191734 RepID=UPI000D560BBE|nr:SH3 domain-containing protein [Aquimarina aquimarini]